jgi:Nucleotidyl transferase AbiEii toxin, Type IV TA system
MPGDNLSPLQWKILEILAGLEPAWTLTGGGALVGVHFKHRLTKDLDLFWHGLDQLGFLPDEVRSRLVATGLEVAQIQTAPGFARFRVSDETSVCLVDLVAEPVPAVEPPLLVSLGRVSIKVDTPHEILVNKLCALLGRLELRDLQDVKVLLESGASLERALTDAPRKDGGFSPLTLAWTLKNLQPLVLARAAGLSQEKAEELEQFREELIQRLLTASEPGEQS